MDISKWTPDQILGLPDFVFGRKFPIFGSLKAGSTTWVTDLSEVGFPDPCVLWEFHLQSLIYGSNDAYVRVGLSNRVAANEAEFMTFLPFLHGLGFQGPEPRGVYFCAGAGSLDFRCKMIVRTGGLRLTVCSLSTAAGIYRFNVSAVVSGIPKEVPDWVFSGRASGQ